MRILLRPFFVLLCLVSGGQLLAQSDGDYRTRATGNWTAATTWQVFVGGSFQNLETAGAGIYQNIIPSNTSGVITLQNNVTINSAVTADQVASTAGTTTISAGGTFSILDGPGVDVSVSGTGIISVTTGSMSFANNATYVHGRNGGSVPNATWGTGSTCTVTGIAGTSPTINNATVFHHFTWDCAAQTGTVTIGLREVNGNFTLEESNNQIVRFATTTAYTLNVDGDMTVNNSGRMAFGTTAAGIVINVGGDFNYNSTGISSLKSSGTYAFTIGGGFSHASGTLRMSTGANTGTMNVAGTYTHDAGATIDETGAGNGLIVFNGTSLQQVTIDGTVTGSINYQVNNAADVQLNSSVTVSGSLTQTLGSVILNGNILTLNGAFTQTSGSLVVDPSSEFIIGGTGALPASISFSGVDMSRVRMNRTGGTLTSSSSLTVDFLDLYAGTLTHTGTLTIVDGGTIERRVGTLTNAVTAAGVYDVVYNNSTASVTTGPELPVNTTVLNNLTIQGGQTVNLADNITINGDLTTTAGVFAAAANSIDLVGNFVSNAGFTTTAGGNFTVSGPTSTLTGGGSTPVFRNLFVTGTFTPSVNFQVNENLDVSGVLNATAGTASFGGTTSVITNSGTLTFSGFDLLAGSTVTFPATTVRVNANFDVSTGTSTFNNGGGTIEFGGTTNLLGTGVKAFNNVTVLSGSSLNGTVSWVLNGALVNDGTVSFTAGVFSTNNGSISGTGSTTFFDMDVVSGTLVQAAGTTISLRDDFDISAGATFSAGAGSTVNFITTTNSITGTGTKNFANINVPGGGTLTYTVTVNVAGNITVDGSWSQSAGTTVFNGGGTSTISGSGTISFNLFTINSGTSVTANSNISFTNNVTANGNFTSNQTVTIAGSASLNPGTGVVTFNNLTINGGVTFTPNDDITINGNLTVSGTLSDGTANAVVTFAGTTTVSGAAVAINFPYLTITGTLTAHPSVTMNVERDFTNNGTFNHNGGTINFTTTGTNQQQILGSNAIVFNNLSVSNVGQATDLTNGNSVSVTVVGTISFSENNAVFDADGAGSGVLILASSNDSPAVDGRIGTITTGSNVSGNFTVQRYVSSENRIWRYIAVPVVGATVAQLKAGIPVTGTFTDPSDGASTPPCTGCITTSPSLYFYDESTQAYVAYPSSGLASANALTNGRGYSAFFRHTGSGAVGIVTLSFTGTNPSAAGIALPVAPAAGNYSLVGNPYPSAIDWASATGWSARTGFSNIAVVRDNATGVHQFLDANSASPQLIAPGQSFWVQTLVGASSLTVNENAKAAGSYSFFRLDQAMEDILELSLTKGTTGTTDNARIVIRPASTNLYDMYDAYKFNNNIDNGTTITEVQDISTLTVEATPKALAVNAIPSINCTQSFNIRVTNFINPDETIVNYTLGINPTGAMAGMTWILHDAYTAQSHNLTTQGAYNFTVDNSIAASKSSSRFSIEATAPVVDVNKTVAASPINCSGNDALVTLSSSQEGIAYGVDVNGIYYPNVAAGNGSDLSIFIDADKLQPGANTIQVRASSGCQVQAVGAPVAINQVELYQAAATSPNPSCIPGVMQLTAEGAPADAVYNWYDSPSSTIVLATGAQYAPMVTATRSYFVAAVNPNGCEGPRVEVIATIADPTISYDVTSSTDQVCRGQKVTFSNTSSSGTGEFLWYTSPDPGAEVIATTASGVPFEPEVSKNTTYYVRFAPAQGCAGDPTEFLVNVIPVSKPAEQTSVPMVCSGQSYTLVASGAPGGSSYRWYSLDGTIPLGTGPTLQTGPLAVESGYQLRAVGPEGCESDAVTYAVAVDSNPSPAGLTVSLDGVTAICQDTETAVTITNPQPGMTYRWYESSDATEAVHEGITLPATQYATTQSYHIAAVNANGCETSAASRKKVDVQVTTFEEPEIDNSFYGVLKSTTADTYQWYVNGEPISNEQDQSLRVFDPGIYSVKVELNGCEAWSNTIFTTDLITSLEEKGRVIRMFPNPVSDELTIHVLGDQPVSGQLLDTQGRPVVSIDMMQDVGQWSGRLDVRYLTRGMYLLRLYSGTQSVTHKVIIK